MKLFLVGIIIGEVAGFFAGILFTQIFDFDDHE